MAFFRARLPLFPFEAAYEEVRDAEEEPSGVHERHDLLALDAIFRFGDMTMIKLSIKNVNHFSSD